MIMHNSRHHDCDLITAKDLVFGGIQRTSSAYRFQAASIRGKLPGGSLDVRYGMGSQYSNLLCSSSHAPLSMLLFPCSTIYILRAMFVVYAPHSVILNFSTVSASTLRDIHFVAMPDVIPEVLAFIHWQTSSMGTWDANEQRSTRVLDVNPRITELSY
jgi:hypothetical protein